MAVAFWRKRDVLLIGGFQQRLGGQSNHLEGRFDGAATGEVKLM